MAEQSTFAKIKAYAKENPGKTILMGGICLTAPLSLTGAVVAGAACTTIKTLGDIAESKKKDD